MIQIMDNLLYKCTLSNMANGCSKYSMLDEEKLRDGHSVNCSFDDMSLMMTRQLQCVIHGVRFEEVEGHINFVIDLALPDWFMPSNHQGLNFNSDHEDDSFWNYIPRIGS